MSAAKHTPTPRRGYGVVCACGRPKARNKTECRWCLSGIPTKQKKPDNATGSAV